MPEAEEEFTVKILEDEVRKILLDLKTIGECFKFVKKTSEDGKIWYVRAPMSAITQTKELEVKILSEKPIEWEARGKHLLWKGKFFTESIESGTKIKAILTVEGLGSMASVINPMAGIQLPGQLRYFVSQLKKRFE